MADQGADSTQSWGEDPAIAEAQVQIEGALALAL